MPEKLFSQGIVEAQAHEMRTDPTIFVAGEDIELGGVFATAKGLGIIKITWPLGTGSVGSIR